MDDIDVLIVGGGQAGLAMSAHLRDRGIGHLVLERGRIAERWRSERWDSLVANGPAWHDRFPAREFDGDPDAFVGKEGVADYFAAFARQIEAPIRTGVEVTRVTREGAGFLAETSAGPVRARRVVAATGPFQKPLIPTVVPESEGLTQIHSSAYKAPGQLPEGAVLVVGAGSSGAQIADELVRAGRKVILSVGPHDRPPRRYRGRDFVWWLGQLGHWQATTKAPGTEHVTIAVSGARGGHTVDFREMAARGVLLVGRAGAFEQGVLHFAPDIAETIRAGDRHHLSVLDEADRFAEAKGLDLPPDPEARRIWPDPECLRSPTTALNLHEAGVRSIVWATGFALDFGWLQVDGAFDAKGRPDHVKGVSKAPGVYFLGLPWLTCRGSAFIWGVWEDARGLAAQMAEAQA